VWAQQTSATLMGVVRDKQGAVVPGATVVLINQEQGTAVRNLKTEGDGSFIIAPLQPATYTLTVEASGFKKFEQKDVKLFANDRLSIGNIELEVGSLTETVTVEAAVVQLQTESAQRSGIVTGVQTVNLALNGRNYLSLMTTVPGVVSEFNGQVAGPGIGMISINGQRTNQNNITLDGVSNMDTGSNNTQHTSLNIDAIAEFKILTNSHPAEFGRSSGGAVNVVTKSGTTEFHGAGYWFHRHEGLNANTWRNNQDLVTVNGQRVAQSRRKYRYNYQGFNVGGPVYIPGKFNTAKDKLFFFFAHEWQEQLVPNNARNVTVPTEAERNGDFRLTHESDGRLVTIRDPLTGQPFPSNTIPQSRWNADGRKILNFYPLPNISGFPDYNYTTQLSASYPRRQLIFRGDWNISEKWRTYVRYIRDKDDQIMPYGQWNADYNIPLGPMHFGQPGRSAIFNLTTIINPTLTNEFIFGPSKNKLDITPVDDAWNRSKLGLSYQMPFPSADPLGLVQNWRFGGVPNAPNSSFNGTPFLNANNSFDFTDNVLKVHGAHQVKFGMFVQRSRKDQTAFTPANGNMWFDRDGQNPGDSNWAFSNALLGNYQRVQQSSIIRNGKYRYTNVEWYAADVWKIRPNLTLDYGMRFYFIQPQYDAALQTSSFNAGAWDPRQAAMLFQRAINPATGSAGARNPLTGEFLPAAMIGALVPGTGARISGAYVNGMRQAGVNDYPRGLIDNRGIHYGPRLGIAWQAFNRTVVRAGAGVFYDRFQGNPVFDMLPNPPSTLTPTLYYGNLGTIGSTQGVLFPADVRGFSKEGKVPTTYQWNFGIQRELPFQLLLDAAYVGSRSNHLLIRNDINRPGFGSAWRPENQDPTAATPRFDGTTTLPVNFYRPYQGYGSVNLTTFGAFSNYNSLQLGLTRRLAQGLQAGVAYTWSKALGLGSDDQGGSNDNLHPLNGMVANYAPLTFDRRHIFAVNFVYETPRLARGSLDNVVTRAIMNNWTISGVGTMITGAPQTVTVGVSGLGGADFNKQWTGDETWGPRIGLTGVKGQLSRDERSIYQFIDPAAFRLPTKPSQGFESAVRGYVYGPGRNNWDLSVFKSFPFSADDRRSVQVRLEMFNAFNHTQYNGINVGATFDRNTGAITNLPTALGGGGGRYGFGALNGTTDPRIIQLGAKVYF
jgi:hypothetical protein